MVYVALRVMWARSVLRHFVKDCMSWHRSAVSNVIPESASISGMRLPMLMERVASGPRKTSVLNIFKAVITSRPKMKGPLHFAKGITRSIVSNGQCLHLHFRNKHFSRGGAFCTFLSFIHQDTTTRRHHVSGQLALLIRLDVDAYRSSAVGSQ